MNQTFMKERRIFPLVLSMALPMMLSMAFSSLYNIVDSYFVAKLSEDAMTALSLVFPAQNLMTSVAVGFGVGTPANILESVDRGVDFFDCVYPSRNGRHGHVYTHRGKINLFNAQYELDNEPIEEGCGCPACRNYSKAYIRHLLKAKEMLGMRLCVLHNLYFYNHLMEDIRLAIEEHRYGEFKRRTLYGLQELDGNIYL